MTCWFRADLSVLVPDEDCTAEHVERQVKAVLERHFGMVTIHDVKKKEED